MNRDESFRLLEDWWNKCRTCRYWSASDEDRIKMTPSICSNINSPLFEHETWTEGYCRYWDAFDIDVAIDVIDYYEKGGSYKR